MGKKAVYNNQMLAIYISQEDFPKLLESTFCFLNVYIGKNKSPIGVAYIALGPHTLDGLTLATNAERQAIKKVQDQFAKDHPDYENSDGRKRRHKHAKR